MELSPCPYLQLHMIYTHKYKVSLITHSFLSLFCLILHLCKLTMICQAHLATSFAIFSGIFLLTITVSHSYVLANSASHL